MYRLFPLFPEAVLAPPAFVSELMGLSVYQHLDGVLDDILDDEPEARERVRTLLREVMTDELAHVGQRRNFLGPLGLHTAHATVESMYRAFFRDIPETKLLFNVEEQLRLRNVAEEGPIHRLECHVSHPQPHRTEEVAALADVGELVGHDFA